MNHSLSPTSYSPQATCHSPQARRGLPLGWVGVEAKGAGADVGGDDRADQGGVPEADPEVEPVAEGRRQGPAHRHGRRHQAGLDPALSLHCLRHSYVTHLVEFGYPERFVQEQVGHAYASTTAIYASVSNDFKDKTLKAALERVYAPTDQEDQ